MIFKLNQNVLGQKIHFAFRSRKLARVVKSGYCNKIYALENVDTVLIIELSKLQEFFT